MNSQGIIDQSRFLHLRELKSEIARLKADNSALRDENAQLRAHLDFAILAARDLESLAEGGRLVIVDGWNLILGANRRARDREELERQAREYLTEHPLDMVWIVLDGPRFASRTDGRLRVSYTGGVGGHRADRFICDFLRMCACRGSASRVEVRTNDKDFCDKVKQLGGMTCPQQSKINR